MKKTVIIAIFLVYLASIVVVQFFGLQVVQLQGKVYVSNITVQGITLTNRTEGQNATAGKVNNDAGDIWYAFVFISGTYTEDEESIASNPNKIKVQYLVEPFDASEKTVAYEFDPKNVIFIEETEEVVFLKRATVTIQLSAKDGSPVKTKVKVSAR